MFKLSENTGINFLQNDGNNRIFNVNGTNPNILVTSTEMIPMTSIHYEIIERLKDIDIRYSTFISFLLKISFEFNFPINHITNQEINEIDVEPSFNLKDLLIENYKTVSHIINNLLVLNNVLAKELNEDQKFIENNLIVFTEKDTLYDLIDELSFKITDINSITNCIISLLKKISKNFNILNENEIVIGDNFTIEDKMNNISKNLNNISYLYNEINNIFINYLKPIKK